MLYTYRTNESANSDCCWARSCQICLDSSATQYWNHVVAVVLLWCAQRHEDVVLFSPIFLLPGFAISENSCVLHQLYEGRHRYRTDDDSDGNLANIYTSDAYENVKLD